MSIKDIVKEISEDKEISKKLIYNYCLEIKEWKWKKFLYYLFL